MLRRDVERLAGEQLAQPADLWLEVPDLNALLGEDAEVDAAKVKAAAAALLAKRPGMRLPGPLPAWCARDAPRVLGAPPSATSCAA